MVGAESRREDSPSTRDDSSSCHPETFVQMDSDFASWLLKPVPHEELPPQRELWAPIRSVRAATCRSFRAASDPLS